MTTIVRQLSDGEEIVVVEGDDRSRVGDDDPREQALGRRSKAMSARPTTGPPPEQRAE